MNNLLKRSAVITGLIAILFCMTASTVEAQTYKYRTTDQKYYLKFVANGDSWTVSTAESGGNWVGSTMLYSDNTNGYYKCKSHRTGATYELWFNNDDSVTMKVLGNNGQYYNWQYYKY